MGERASTTKSAVPAAVQRDWRRSGNLAFRKGGEVGGLGVVTAPALAAERDELPSGLGLSFISKRRQMVGLALAPSPQPPKVCFRDGCGERQRCRGGRGTSAGADKGGGGAAEREVEASTSGLLAAAATAAAVRVSISLILSRLLALVFLSLSQVCLISRTHFKRRADI